MHSDEPQDVIAWARLADRHIAYTSRRRCKKYTVHPSSFLRLALHLVCTRRFAGVPGTRRLKAAATDASRPFFGLIVEKKMDNAELCHNYWLRVVPRKSNPVCGAVAITQQR